MSYYAIKTTYHGPTATKGAKIIATWADLARVVVPYGDENSSDKEHWAALVALMQKTQRHGAFVEGYGPDQSGTRYYVPFGLLIRGPGPVYLIGPGKGERTLIGTVKG